MGKLKYADFDAELKRMTVDAVVTHYGVTQEAAREFLEEFSEYDTTSIMTVKPMSEEYETYHLQMIWGRDEKFERMMGQAADDARIDREEQLESHFDQRDHYNGE